MSNDFIQRVRDFSAEMVSYTADHVSIKNGVPQGLNLKTKEEVMAYIEAFQVGPARCMRMFAEIRSPDGIPYAGDPRVILKRELGRLDDYGFSHMNIGPEAEFFYFASDESPEVLDKAGYFDMVPVDVGDDFREATRFALQAMGINVEYMHHEVAHSQHEIDLKYCDALRMADNLQTYKWLVKEIARRNGIHATFMPKPLSGQNGSGMHVHLSIFNDANSNAFYEADDPHHLSQTARHFLAGVLDNARGLHSLGGAEPFSPGSNSNV